MKYLTSGEICSLLKITPMTLMRWKNEGRLHYKKITSKKYLYDVDSLNIEFEREKRLNVIYARVSNTKQKDDLSKQIDILKSYMLANGVKPDYVYSDIASGMNEQRKEFNKLLKDVFDGKIDSVYISFKDRLTRFGFEYFKNIFSYFDTKIEIINYTQEENFQKELTEDLISIIHHFSMKVYSNRRKILKDAEKMISEI